MTYTFRFCAECGLEIKAHETICPRCESPEISERENTMAVVNPATLSDAIAEELSHADDMIATPWPCFRCGGEHFMVMPVRRDPKNYNEVQKLTTFPQCPIRVWEMSNNIKMPIAIVRAKYKVEG